MPGGQWINRYRERDRNRLVIGKARGPEPPQSEEAGADENDVPVAIPLRS